jgi:hypothetical protein
VAISRSLCEPMNSYYAGLGRPGGSKPHGTEEPNVNGASQEEAHAGGRDLFRERMWYCADKDARRLDERADKS